MQKTPRSWSLLVLLRGVGAKTNFGIVHLRTYFGGANQGRVAQADWFNNGSSQDGVEVDSVRVMTVWRFCQVSLHEAVR